MTAFGIDAEKIAARRRGFEFVAQRRAVQMPNRGAHIGRRQHGLSSRQPDIRDENSASAIDGKRRGAESRRKRCRARAAIGGEERHCVTLIVDGEKQSRRLAHKNRRQIVARPFE